MAFPMNFSRPEEDFYAIQEEVNAGGSAQVFRAVEIATKAQMVRMVKQMVIQNLW